MSYNLPVKVYNDFDYITEFCSHYQINFMTFPFFEKKPHTYQQHSPFPCKPLPQLQANKNLVQICLQICLFWTFHTICSLFIYQKITKIKKSFKSVLLQNIEVNSLSKHHQQLESTKNMIYGSNIKHIGINWTEYLPDL